MALIRLDPKDTIEYIPRFDRKNGKDPLIVHMKFVPAVLRDTYLRNMGRELQNAGTDLEKSEISKAHDKNMFVAQIPKVENFFDAVGSPIDDVGVFYESIDYELRAELIDAMCSQSELTKGQRKN